jgi:hypothetical protein
MLREVHKMTQLERMYFELVRKGLIVPVTEPSTEFQYPTVLRAVPSFTSYGVGDTRGLNEEQIAELERNSK